MPFKTLSHQKLCLLLSVYIGWVLNISVFYQRFSGADNSVVAWKGVTVMAEIFACLLVTFFLFRLLSIFGLTVWRLLATFVVLCSVAASYYMVTLKVVIGYGIIASVMTTDIDLSKEAVGYRFGLWILLGSAIPLSLIWVSTSTDTLLQQLRTRGQRIKSLAVVLLSALLVWAPLRAIGEIQSSKEHGSIADMASYGGVVASAYLPVNWVSSLGLFAWARAGEANGNASLLNPAETFTYVAPQGIEDTYVVFIIGETTRWDHMGILGYPRDTTPVLSKEKNLVAFRGESCDTATKLSLRCMFVREGGTDDNPQRTLREQNVFAVLNQLGFSAELFALQSEVWFYKNAMPDSFAFREQIAAEPRNQGKRIDDMQLVEEVRRSLNRHQKGQHLIILHTKGSHFSYAQRYPRSFARWTPECISIDEGCSKEKLINAYDNSVLYVDTVIGKVLDEVRDKKAIVFYAADHGQSIGDGIRLHGTPRDRAPPEQFRVPLLVWASDKYLENEASAAAFRYLREQSRMNVTRRHVELYDTVLGCLGYTSPDGGLRPANNWCQRPEIKKVN